MAIQHNSLHSTLLLCRASSTTLVQSYYYYYCAELLRLLLCRASTSTLAQSARARCPQLFLADEGLPRQIKSNWRQWTTQQCYWQQCLWKENHRTLQECLLYTKSGWTMVKLLTWRLNSCISFFHSLWTHHSCDEKHRKNCECCPGHSLTVSRPSKSLSL